MEQFIVGILPKIEHLRYLSYWFVFLASVLETLPFLGLVTPGTLILVIAGFFAAHGSFDIGDMIWFAALGGIAGDSIGYYLGKYRGRKLFSETGKFFHTRYLEKAGRYFRSHGGKSVLWGRLIGPIRPFIAFVAGLGHMDYGRFFVFNALGSFLWAGIFLLLGYFFGLSSQFVFLWAERAGFLLFLFLAFLALNIYIGRLIYKNKDFIKDVFKGIIGELEHSVKESKFFREFSQNHPKLLHFILNRISPAQYVGLHLTIGIAVTSLFLWAFIGVIEDLASRDPLYFADLRIINLVQIFRTPFWNQIMLFVTDLGRWQVIFSLIITAFLILWAKRNYHRMAGLFLAVLGGELFVGIIKNMAERARPPIASALYIEPSFSFPSGHAAVAMTFYGTVVYFLAKSVKSWRLKILIMLSGAFLIFAIGLSRIYLGVHYPSDVLGGYFLGLLWITTIITALEIAERFFLKARFHPFPLFLSPASFMLFVFLTLSGNAAFIIDFYKSNPLPVLSPVAAVIKEISEPEEIFGSLPKFTETLVGTSMEPVSFVFIGSNEAIENSFRNAGWQRADSITPKSVVNLALSAVYGVSYPSAPVTPSFFNFKPNDFAFEKSTDKNTVRERHHIRFWKTDFSFRKNPVWVASASFDSGIRYFITHRINPAIDTERDYIIGEIKAVNQVSVFSEFQLVEPKMGKNQVGDQFFTDGKLYVIQF